MEPDFLQTQILAQIALEAEQLFARIDDLAHGWEHVSRVYVLALHIAEREGADRFIVGAAALLHDLGRADPIEEQPLGGASASAPHHADLSVTLARSLLAAHRVPLETQQAIAHVIEAHSFSRGIEPRTLEARVVRDADRLDSLGAIGVLRWAITGAVLRSRIASAEARATVKTYHPSDPFAENHAPDDHTYMLDHFYSKLLKLNSTLLTETGRALGKGRTAFMYQYLDELRAELS